MAEYGGVFVLASILDALGGQAVTLVAVFSAAGVIVAFFVGWKELSRKDLAIKKLKLELELLTCCEAIERRFFGKPPSS